MNARRLVPVLLAILVAALCSALGFWQLDRAAQKRAWLQAHQAALDSSPQALADALRGRSLQPRRAEGRLLLRSAAPWVLLDNQRRGHEVGVRAYRIAEVAGMGPPQALLVEFGWLPMPADRSLPQLPEPEPELEAAGLLLSPPSVGLRLGRSAPPPARSGPMLVAWLDPVELGGQLGIALHPQVFRPDPELPVGFARDREALPNTLPPEKHLGYAFQWFGLAATVVIITLVLLLRKRRPT